MIRLVGSPLVGASAPPAQSSAPRGETRVEQPVCDRVDLRASAGPAAPSPSSGFARRAGATVLAGVALLGAGVLAPSAANAQMYMRPGYVHTMPRAYAAPPPAAYYQQRDNTANVVRGMIAGAILGTAVGVIASQASAPPPVVVVSPPPLYQQPADGGGDAVACDGQLHHFDAYGNIADGTGHYRLSVNGWGNCVATPATPY